MAQFLPLAIINLALILWIIRRRGMASVEGVCMMYLLVALLADHACLLFKCCFAPGQLREGDGELALRVYPTLVHILGLLSLMAGMYIANPNPAPLRRNDATTLHGSRTLVCSGLALAAQGATFFLIALVLVGARVGDADYYQTMERYRSDSALTYGAFWMSGTTFLVIGLGFALAGCRHNWKLQVSLFMLMVIVPLFLTSNKGGAERACLVILIIAASYNREVFAFLLRPQVLAFTIPAVLLALGYKVLLLAARTENWDVVGSLSNALQAVSSRFSDEGLYRGYCKFVNYFTDHPEFHDQFHVGVYTLVSWIPRMVYESKAPHPFLGLGWIFNADGHAYPGEACAPMAMGYAYADYGMVSVILYMFLGGVFLGLFRRILTRAGAPLTLHISYTAYALLGGFSSEGGFLSATYALGLIAPVMLINYMVVKFLLLPGPAPGRLPAAWLPVEPRAPATLGKAISGAATSESPPHNP